MKIFSKISEFIPSSSLFTLGLPQKKYETTPAKSKSPFFSIPNKLTNIGRGGRDLDVAPKAGKSSLSSKFKAIPAKRKKQEAKKPPSTHDQTSLHDNSAESLHPQKSQAVQQQYVHFTRLSETDVYSPEQRMRLAEEKRKEQSNQNAVQSNAAIYQYKNFANSTLPEIPRTDFYLSFSEEFGKLKNRKTSVFSDEFMQSFIQEDVNYILDKMKPAAKTTSASLLNDSHKTDHPKTVTLQQAKAFEPKVINNLAQKQNKRTTVELSAQKVVFRKADALKVPNPALKNNKDEEISKNSHRMTVASFATRVPIEYGQEAQPATAELFQIARSA
ncbi:MAG: hypothetical protein ON057_002008 [Glomeribacter sp. 1016415]|nr:hypothetical protein [Glomeribacter sp. 1016415]